MPKTTRLVLAACLALAAPLAASPAVAADPPWTVVATGLDNPRLLSWSGHALYVAEAGRGGDGPCVEGAEGLMCLGDTGAITRVSHGGQDRVLEGLPSLATEGGGGAIGPADVVQASPNRLVATMGLGNVPAVRGDLGATGRLFGTLVTGSVRGPDRVRVIADLAAYEAAEDPDGHGPDSNPVGLVETASGWAVADAGGNDLVRVGRGGGVGVLAVFPDRMVPTPPFLPPGQMPMQAVPTSVVVGPDGAFYVSQLTGFPFPQGASTIWRVVPGGQPVPYATGLTNVTDLAWHDGDLYAVQLSDVGLLAEPALPMGSLVRVDTAGAHETVVGGLPAPYGVALHDDAAFVTTCAVCPGAGSVVRMPLS